MDCSKYHAMSIAATALIAEDEPLLAQALQDGLRACWPGLDVAAIAANGQQAVDLALKTLPDVLFLDIRMPGQSGLDAAQAIVEDWPNQGRPLPLVVFVTAYDQYAISAFEREAADYLLKPVEPERLAQACARLQARLAERRGSARGGGTAQDAQALDALRAVLAQFGGAALNSGASGPATAGSPGAVRLTVIQASSGSTLHMVPVNEVLFFEAADKYVRVVTAQREHLIRTALRELLPQLDPALFWQVHRSAVVRAEAIDRVTRDDSGRLWLYLRQRNERLPVSRIHAHLFKAM